MSSGDAVDETKIKSVLKLSRANLSSPKELSSDLGVRKVVLPKLSGASATLDHKLDRDLSLTRSLT